MDTESWICTRTTHRHANSPVVRHPSIHLSVTFVYCIRMAEDILKLLFRPCSHIILIFWPPVLVPDSKGNPFSGEHKYTCNGEICDFLLQLPFISETIQGRPLLLWIFNSKSYMVDCVGSDDLEWPWKAGYDGSTFQLDLLNNARTVLPRMTKFGRITRGEGDIYRGQQWPYHKGVVPSTPQFWGFPSNFDMTAPEGRGACFYGSFTPAPQGCGHHFLLH